MSRKRSKRVLILCTGNSARSQMAEGLLRHDARDAFAVESAGLEPKYVRPEPIEAMREIGIDISGQQSKALDKFIGQTFDYVITVCDNANQNCPIFRGAKRRIHWSVGDPAVIDGPEETRLQAFRATRDSLRERLAGFIKSSKESTG